ncbi:UDP-2,4-diacetamido-2,4,6-trideoxy-beta-L-altropyranose hydrolase [Lachnospiraceae bacterium 45-W7]
MKKIAFRLDTGNSIGAGHFIRCMALADELSEISGYDIIFICRNKLEQPSRYPVIYIEKPYVTKETIYEFPSIIDEMDELTDILNKENIDCLIVDHYGAKDDYFQKLKKFVPYLVCIDDSLERHIPTDIVINGNIFGADAEYGNIPLKLTGSSYLLLRPMFRNVAAPKNNAIVKDIYITSGGADPCEFCYRISTELRNHFSDMNLHVIAGCSFSKKYIMKLQKLKLSIHQNADMKECILNADFFISSAGSTLYELALCGVPSICYILAEDQKLLAEYMSCRGSTYLGGNFQSFCGQAFFHQCQMLFSNRKKREKMSEHGKALIDGFGAKRTAEKLFQFIRTP